ncbi:D-xylose 1-dehydrogenase (NADP(+)) 2 [Fusarium oxysporum f. sp. albedinis]|nr:D-xylose 1-dehydrogenase (NADP(+)) 2 [Fusarium oxysporum f. sp. albedinis]
MRNEVVLQGLQVAGKPQLRDVNLCWGLTCKQGYFKITAEMVKPLREKIGPINATYTPANTFCIPLYVYTLSENINQTLGRQI